MLMVVIVIFKAVDASISMKWKPGLIPRLFKSSGNYVKACIVSFSLLFFVDVFWVVLRAYIYMTYMYLFPLLDLLWKRPHRSE